MAHMAHQEVAGQVAIVTGGGRGLGRAIAIALADAGAAVAIVARSDEQLAETATFINDTGGVARAYPLDVTDGVAVRAMAADVERSLGSVDLLINNAGVVTPLGPLWEVDAEEWWRCQDVGIRGALLCTQAVLPSMIARQKGRIINMASAAGLKAYKYASAYVISKTALIRMTENLAEETREYGISAFSVEPAAVRTAMTEYLYESDEGKAWTPWFQQVFEQELSPMEEVTALIGELASGRADALSGCTIGLGDDLEAMVRRADEIRTHALYLLRQTKLTS
jgi:NAD(P)-dependent dehydrogenase (short-subunit alcohol dehydrogenase family)